MVCVQIDRVRDEPDRAIGRGKVASARMPAAEDAGMCRYGKCPGGVRGVGPIARSNTSPTASATKTPPASHATSTGVSAMPPAPSAAASAKIAPPQTESNSVAPLSFSEILAAASGAEGYRFESCRGYLGLNVRK